MLRFLLLALFVFSGCSKSEEGYESSASTQRFSVEWPDRQVTLFCRDAGGSAGLVLYLNYPSAGKVISRSGNGSNIFIDQYVIDGLMLKIVKPLYVGEAVNGMSAEYKALRLSSMRARGASFFTFMDSIYVLDSPPKTESGIDGVSYSLLSKSGGHSVVASYMLDGESKRDIHDDCDLLDGGRDSSSKSEANSMTLGHEQCVDFVVNNYLASDLRKNSDVLDGLRRDCQKPRYALCLHKKIHDARSGMGADDAISAAELDEWSMDCEK